MNRTFISKKGQLRGNRIKWRAVDEILLTSLEHVPPLALDGVSICLRIAHFLPGIVPKGYKAGYHIHDVIHLQFVMEGAFCFKTGKHSVLLKSGNGIIIPAQQVHCWACKRAGVLFGASVGVTGQFAMDFMEHVKRHAGDSFLSCSNPDLLNGLLRIIELALKPAPFHWRREMAGLELSLWLARVLHTALDLRPLKTPVPYRNKTQTDPSRRLCEEAVRFIMSNFSRPLKVRDAAGHIGITTRHLNRLFRLFLHDTAHALLLRTRLEHADKVLKSSPAMKIKEIAFASGFQSPSYFSQCYKQYFNRLPTGKS
ncbi:MAG: AraC family transcriptional regulator [Kiritimatiellia bacterium]|nr:AraC family transcriptional regulator [Kiritimatiellia bacterium]